MADPRRAADPSSHIGFLDEAEDKPNKARKKAQPESDEDGLDLDRIW